MGVGVVDGGFVRSPADVHEGRFRQRGDKVSERERGAFAPYSLLLKKIKCLVRKGVDRRRNRDEYRPYLCKFSYIKSNLLISNLVNHFKYCILRD